MRCLLCEKLSFQIICKTCQTTLLIPSFHKREIERDFYNYSFYSLSELEDLISSKYHFFGDKVFNILAKLSFEKFALNFKFDKKITAIPIDDHTRHEFSPLLLLTPLIIYYVLQILSNMQEKIKNLEKKIQGHLNLTIFIIKQQFYVMI